MEFEIFRTGKHTANNGNTKTYTEQDLDKIVESYNPKESEAPIVVGHPKDNSPAYGWIESLKRVGDRLIAKARDIVPEFSEALQKKLYKKRSISLTPDGKLRHVGFLGGALPAVKGLTDISFNEPSHAVYEMDTQEAEFNEDDISKESENKTEDKNKILSGKDKPETPADLSSFSETLNQIQTMIKDLSDNFSSLEPSLDNTQLQQVNSRIDDLRFKVNLSEFQILLNEKLSNGSLTPAMKNKVLNLLNFLDAQNFSDDFDSDSFKNDFKGLLVDFIKSVPKIISFENFAEKPETEIKMNEEDYAGFPVDEYSSSLHKKAITLMHKDELTYLDAIKRISEN